MLAMLASLVSRLRGRIQTLERELTQRELEPYWKLLAEAEWLVYRNGVADFPTKSKEIEERLKRMLGVKG
jgi:hypothetical protein